ncbi:MAG: Lar family restriction alleviation protein [Rhodospirillaceae bacterium]
MSNELKPCPFCGAQPTIEPWHGGKPTKRMISCENDDCAVCPSVSGNTEREAVEAWNRRASPADPSDDPVGYVIHGCAAAVNVPLPPNTQLYAHPPRPLSELSEERIAEVICREVAELSDRNSPADWPEAMLVTHDELRNIILNALRENGDAKDARPCTCHPDDNPPAPCPRKYALSECRKAAQEPPMTDREEGIEAKLFRKKPVVIEALQCLQGDPHCPVLFGDPCERDCAAEQQINRLQQECVRLRSALATANGRIAEQRQSECLKDAAIDRALQRATAAEARVKELREALSELVRLKDIKEQMEAYPPASQMCIALQDEYEEAKPKAWAAARAALAKEAK